MYRFLLVNLLALAGLVYGQVYFDLIVHIWHADSSHIVALIAAGIIWSLYLVARRRFDDADWTAEQLVALGLFGTVVGFVVSLANIDPVKAGDVSAITPMVSQLLLGMGIALYTTLLGQGGALWVRFCIYLMQDEKK